jgi:hypothetical protein
MEAHHSRDDLDRRCILGCVKDKLTGATDQCQVKMPSGFRHDVESLFGSEPRLGGLVLGEDHEDIRDRRQPDEVTNAVSRQAIWVAVPVQPFMMLGGHLDNTGVQPLLSEQNVAREAWMALHRGTLHLVKPTRLVEDFNRNLGFSDVMEEAADRHPFQINATQAELSAEEC